MSYSPLNRQMWAWKQTGVWDEHIGCSRINPNRRARAMSPLGRFAQGSEELEEDEGKVVISTPTVVIPSFPSRDRKNSWADIVEEDLEMAGPEAQPTATMSTPEGTQAILEALRAPTPPGASILEDTKPTNEAPADFEPFKLPTFEKSETVPVESCKRSTTPMNTAYRSSEPDPEEVSNALTRQTSRLSLNRDLINPYSVDDSDFPDLFHPHLVAQVDHMLFTKKMTIKEIAEQFVRSGFDEDFWHTDGLYYELIPCLITMIGALYEPWGRVEEIRLWGCRLPQPEENKIVEEEHTGWVARTEEAMNAEYEEDTEEWVQKHFERVLEEPFAQTMPEFEIAEDGDEEEEHEDGDD